MMVTFANDFVTKLTGESERRSADNGAGRVAIIFSQLQYNSIRNGGRNVRGRCAILLQGISSSGKLKGYLRRL